MRPDLVWGKLVFSGCRGASELVVGVGCVLWLGSSD